MAATQRALIQGEVESILPYAVQWNAVQENAAARRELLDSWRQITRTTLLQEFQEKFTCRPAASGQQAGGGVAAPAAPAGQDGGGDCGAGAGGWTGHSVAAADYSTLHGPTAPPHRTPPPSWAAGTGSQIFRTEL